MSKKNEKAEQLAKIKAAEEEQKRLLMKDKKKTKMKKEGAELAADFESILDEKLWMKHLEVQFKPPDHASGIVGWVHFFMK